MIAVWARSVILRLGMIAVLWVTVTEAAPTALGYGAVAVPLVAAVTYVLTGRPVARGRGVAGTLGAVVGALGLAGWILWRSVVGGIDVSRRALWLPRPDISPEWIEYRSEARSPGARAALLLVANLMPGSLTARLEGDIVQVHVISRDLPVIDSLAELERRIIRIAGEG